MVTQYAPNQGDIVYLDFDPQAGREQKGRRPCLIVSNSSFHKRTKLAMVCPITSTSSNFPTHIALDATTRTSGEIMCEQAKFLDIVARNASFIETVPSDILDEAIDLAGSWS